MRWLRLTMAIALVALSACAGRVGQGVCQSFSKNAAKVERPEGERVPFGPDLRAAELRSLAATLRDGYSHLLAKQAEWHFDLDGLVARYEPAIRGADTWSRYELLMVAFVSELHDGHVAWRRVRAPGERRRRIARLGLSTRFLGDALYVSEVWPGSAVERAGVHVGDRLVAMEGMPLEQRFDNYQAVRSWSRLEEARYDFGDDWPAFHYAIGTTPPPLEIVRLREDGGRETLRIAPETAPPPGRVTRPPLSVERRGEVTLVRVRSLRALLDPRRLDELGAALFAADATRGVVFDIRDDSGGYERPARDLVSRLTAHPVTGGSYRVRLTPRARAEHVEWKNLVEDPSRPGWSLPQPLRAEPAAARDYPGRVAVIVDAGCRSACETLALELRAFGARLFGETTGGMSGAPITYTLPWSHAQVTIPAWELLDANGAPIEGRGVVPDEPVAPTLDDLRARRDPALDRALAWAAAR